MCVGCEISMLLDERVPKTSEIISGVFKKCDFAICNASQIFRDEYQSFIESCF